MFLAPEYGTYAREQIKDHEIPKAAPNKAFRPHVSITFWNASQLEQAARPDLRRRAQALQDALGAENLPNLPHKLPDMACWILNAQVELSKANGCPKSLADFGVKAPPAPISLADRWIRDPGDVDPALTLKDLMPPPAPPVVMSESARRSFAASKQGQAAARQRNAGQGIF